MSEIDIKKLVLRNSGMFSNVNEVIQQLYLAEMADYKFIIDWHRSCYRDESRPEDPWLYYFEDCFPELDANDINIETLPKLPNEPVIFTRDNIITPHHIEGKLSPLLLPNNRSIAYSIIEKYIAVNKLTKNKIDAFKKGNFHGYIIGLHIRGAGRFDNGVFDVRNNYTLRHGIPFKPYFKAINKILKTQPNAKIFACSDSQRVIDEIIKKYKNRVITYDSTRSNFGEMHTNHGANGGVYFPKYKLGLDVVVEAYLLSEADIFIHGDSNIVNFVLCKNPKLRHICVYDHYKLDLLFKLYSSILKVPSKIKRKLAKIIKWQFPRSPIL